MLFTSHCTAHENEKKKEKKKKFMLEIDSSSCLLLLKQFLLGHFDMVAGRMQESTACS